MKNLKTTLFGLIKGGALIYASTKVPNPELQGALIVAGLGAIGLGVVSKDNNVTGGKIQQ